MKTIKLRALWFMACKPKMVEVEVTDEFFDQIPCGIPEEQLSQLLDLHVPLEKVRRFQIQYNGEIIYSSRNKSSLGYPCDKQPW